MTTENDTTNQSINQVNQDGIDLLKNVFNEWMGQKEAEKKAAAERENFENERKRLEEEKNKLAESQRIAEENQKKLYEDVKTKAPEIDRMAKAFKNNSDLEDGIGFLTSINALIDSEEYTAEEIAKMIKNDFTEEDFAKFKANDDAAKITHKMHKICSKYKNTRNLPNPTNIKQEAEQPLKEYNPTSYHNQMFTRPEDIRAFLETYRKN